jgi:hypothetical protein
MKQVLSLALAVFLVTNLPHRAAAGDGADLAAYIETIRASGMSETATSAIRTVASIVSGATILSFRPDPSSGQYYPSYMSATCPKPDADEPELTQWKQMKTSESGALLPRLKPFADADGSGFVTTEEAMTFRYLVEFGYLAEQAARDEAPSMEVIARAAGKDAAATEVELRRYTTLSKRVADAGVAGLPDLDIPELKAAQN